LLIRQNFFGSAEASGQKEKEGNEFLAARQYRTEGAIRVGNGGAFCVSRKAKQKFFLSLKEK